MVRFLIAEKFKERIDPNKEKIPAHVLQVIEEELTKLQLLEASSSEFNVTRNYLDWLTILPWGNYRFSTLSLFYTLLEGWEYMIILRHQWYMLCVNWLRICLLKFAVMKILMLWGHNKSLTRITMAYLT